MASVTASEKQKKAKQEFVYFIRDRWTSFGSGVTCINNKEIIDGQFKIFNPVIKYMAPSHFPQMSGVPLLQFEGKDSKYHDDFEILGGIWILSPPVREFFEHIDSSSLEFRECRTVYPDGSPGPIRSAALVTRMVDALDREKSEAKANYYDTGGGGTLMLSGLKKNYFRKSVVGNFDFFTVPQASTRVLVSQRVKDEFKRNAWRGAVFDKAYLV